MEITPAPPTDLPARLGEFFAHRPDVTIAYLFGSRARGEGGPRSDVDVAVVLSPAIPEESASWLRLELWSDLASWLGRHDVDLVLLEHAPPLLAHRVIRDSLILKDDDPKRRITLEERIIHRYVDTKPLRNAQWQLFRAQRSQGR